MDHKLINPQDYQKFIENVPNNKVELIWAGIVSELPTEQLKKEARAKGFALLPHPTIREDGISKTFIMTVPNGSQELLSQFNRLHNVVSLIKD